MAQPINPAADWVHEPVSRGGYRSIMVPVAEARPLTASTLPLVTEEAVARFLEHCRQSIGE
jgi:hypothetical protein